MGQESGARGNKTTLLVGKDVAERFRRAVRKRHGSLYRNFAQEVEDALNLHATRLEQEP